MKQKNNKIDLHILIHHEQDRSENLKRVKRKLGKVRHFVNVHEIPGVERHIGLGRKQGFSKGDQPYVSFVDDDDDVEQSIFEYCINVLDQNPDIDAVVTDERHVINGKIKQPLRTGLPKDGELYNLKTARYIHHLVVIRRSTLIPYLEQLCKWPDLCEFTLYGKMLLDGCKFMHIDRVGYYWFIHENGSKSLKISPSPETMEILKNMYQRDS